MGKAGMEQAATELVEVQAMMHTKHTKKTKQQNYNIMKDRQTKQCYQSINQGFL